MPSSLSSLAVIPAMMASISPASRAAPKPFQAIFLMTSSAEGWPMVLMEAAQMGTPVVAMDSFGSLHDMVKDGENGRIVPNNDVPALVAAMNTMMAMIT